MDKMFKSKSDIDIFQSVLAELSVGTKGKKPTTLHNSVTRLLKSTDGFSGKSVDALIAHMYASKRKTQSKSTKSTGVGSLKKPHSDTLVAQIVQDLKATENDLEAFEKRLRDFDKSCGAQTVKIAASNYAAASIPKSKKGAIQLFLSARASRVRSRLKHKESALATPW